MEVWAFAIVIGVAISEVVLSLGWNKLYFSVGIPIFRQELPAHNPQLMPPSPQSMERGLSKSAFPPLVFRQLDEERLGFREKAAGAWLRINYTPIMHGMLRFNRPSARVEVVGFVNWFALAMVLAGLTTWLSFREPTFLVVLVVVLGLIYWIQVRRYRQVATWALQEWNAVWPAGAGA